MKSTVRRGKKLHLFSAKDVIAKHPCLEAKDVIKLGQGKRGTAIATLMLPKVELDNKIWVLNHVARFTPKAQKWIVGYMLCLLAKMIEPFSTSRKDRDYNKQFLALGEVLQKYGEGRKSLNRMWWEVEVLISALRKENFKTVDSDVVLSLQHNKLYHAAHLALDKDRIQDNMFFFHDALHWFSRVYVRVKEEAYEKRYRPVPFAASWSEEARNRERLHDHREKTYDNQFAALLIKAIRAWQRA